MTHYNCPQCDHPNRLEYYYCSQCGTPLVCPRCRVLQLEPSRFCANCGMRLAQSPDEVFLPGEGEGQVQILNGAARWKPVLPDLEEVEEKVPTSQLEELEIPDFSTRTEAVPSAEADVAEEHIEQPTQAHIELSEPWELLHEPLTKSQTGDTEELAGSMDFDEEVPTQTISHAPEVPAVATDDAEAAPSETITDEVEELAQPSALVAEEPAQLPTIEERVGEDTPQPWVGDLTIEEFPPADPQDGLEAEEVEDPFAFDPEPEFLETANIYDDLSEESQDALTVDDIPWLLDEMEEQREAPAKTGIEGWFSEDDFETAEPDWLKPLETDAQEVDLPFEAGEAADPLASLQVADVVSLEDDEISSIIASLEEAARDAARIDREPLPPVDDAESDLLSFLDELAAEVTAHPSTTDQPVDTDQAEAAETEEQPAELADEELDYHGVDLDDDPITSTKPGITHDVLPGEELVIPESNGRPTAQEIIPDIEQTARVKRWRDIENAGLEEGMRTLRVEVDGLTEVFRPGARLSSLLPEGMKSRMEIARQNDEIRGGDRLVTILVCDLVNPSQVATRLEPNEFAELMNGIYEYMLRPLDQYEGSVGRLGVDGLLAFFGAPTAHTDDPVRAVRAGLDIIQGVQVFRAVVNARWGVDFDLRAAVHTGVVTMGGVAPELQMAFIPGDTSDAASRLLKIVPSGTVQITGETYQEVSSVFDCKSFGAIEASPHALHAYQVLGEKKIAWKKGGLAKLFAPRIGRDREWAKLISACAALGKGVGSLVFLSGGAGLGKTRLIREFALYSSDLEMAWHQFDAQEDDQYQPYGIIRKMLLDLVGGTLSDSTETFYKKYLSFQAQLPEKLSALAQPAFQGLFSLHQVNVSEHAEGEAFYRSLHTFIKSFWNWRAEKQQTILVFDDMHWSDRASEKIISGLFQLTKDVPLMIICAAQVDATDAAWSMQKEAEAAFPNRVTSLLIEPFSKKEIDALLDHLLVIAALPEGLRTMLVDQAQGNPFFLEELVRLMIEETIIVREPVHNRWITELDEKLIFLPETLQDGLYKRMGLLGEAGKRVLQMIAGLGGLVSQPQLEMLFGTGIPLDDILSELQQRVWLNTFGEAPLLHYHFYHALAQEAAYETSSPADRQKGHLKIGGVLETLFPDQLETLAPILSSHFFNGGDSPRALHYAMTAADAAFRLAAYGEAVAHYTHALEIISGIEQGEDSELQTTSLGGEEMLTYLYIRRGRALELDGKLDDALANYLAMRQQAQDLEISKMELASLVEEGTLRAGRETAHDASQARDVAEQALTLAETLGDEAAAAQVLRSLINILRHTDDYQKAAEVGERALEIARRLNLKEMVAHTLNDLAYVYMALELERLPALFSETHKLWRELNNQPMLSESLATASIGTSLLGDLPGAVTQAEEALAISEKAGRVWHQAYSRYFIGEIYWMQGLTGKAIETMRASIAQGDQVGLLEAQVWTRMHLAIALAELGDFEGAAALAGAAHETALAKLPGYLGYTFSQLGMLAVMKGDLKAAGTHLQYAAKNHNHSLEVLFDPYTRRPQIHLALRKGDVEAALDLAHQMIAYSQVMRIRLKESQYLFDLALVYEAQGDQVELRDALTRARMSASSLGDRWTLWQILSRLADLKERPGAGPRKETPDQLQAAAHEILIDIIDRIPDDRLRASFQERPDVRRVMEGQRILG